MNGLRASELVDLGPTGLQNGDAARKQGEVGHDTRSD
jgi:hypothetical protein